MTENKWYEKPLRIAHYFCMGSGKGETAEQFVDDMAKLNVNAIHFDGRGELLKDVCRLMHERGIRVFAYHTPFIGAEAKQIREELASHHEWNSMTAAQVSSGDKGLPGSHKCCNTAFKEWTYAWMKKTVEDYEVDGIFYDGYAIPPGQCYCEICRKRFRAQYEEDIPVKRDEKSPLWKKFKQFRYAQVSEFIKGCHKAVKEGNPKAIFYMNGAGINRLSWCTGRNPLMLRDGVDIVGSEAFEYYYPESLRYRALWAQGATAKLNVSAGKGKPAVVFVTLTARPWGKRALPGAALKSMSAQVIANGAGVWYESSYYTHNSSLKENEDLAKSFAFFKDNEECYEGAKSAANVALLWSVRNGDYYAADPAETSDWTSAEEKGEKEGRNVYLSAWRGTYDMLLRAHIPFDLITDEDLTLTGLNNYRVIVLANTPCLSESQHEALRQYVNEGGGLICSYETSLYDEWGNERNDFGLRDLLGVTVVKEKDFGNLWKEYNHFTLTNTNHPITKGVRQSIPSPTYARVVRAVQGEEVLGVVDLTNHPMQHDKEMYPAIVAREYGKGRVVYTSGDLGERYWSANFPEIKELIRNSVVWTGGDSLPVHVEAPETVEVILAEQQEKNRHLLHLINYSGEMARPLNRIIPLRDIKIRLKTLNSVRVRKAQTLVGKSELRFETTHDGISFVLPELDWYEAVVLE